MIIKTFESWRSSSKLRDNNKKIGVFDEEPLDFEQYEIAVAEIIVSKMEETIGQKLSPIVVGDNAIEYIIDLIGEQKNEYGESIPKYPHHFKASIGDLYEYDINVESAADELVDGCLELYYDHGAAL